jgi:hypothetical protein
MGNEIVRWLTGVLDEVERTARAAPGCHWLDSDEWVITEDAHIFGEGDPAAVVHIAMHDPAAVLADVAVKRELLASIEHGIADEGLAQHQLRLLASAYASWPGHREEWRPRDGGYN